MRTFPFAVLGLSALVSAAAFQAGVSEEAPELLPVRGRVVHWKTGVPVAGIELQLDQWAPGQDALVKTDEEGRFVTPAVFHRPNALADDPIYVDWTATGDEPCWELDDTEVWDPGLDREHVIRGHPPVGEVVLKTIVPDGNPDRPWYVLDSTGLVESWQGPVWSDLHIRIYEGGRTSFPLTVYLVTPDEDADSFRASLVSDWIHPDSLPAKPLEVAVYPPGNLRVLVTDNAGEPRPQAVAVYGSSAHDPPGSIVWWQGETGEDGSFLLEGLPAGESRIVVADWLTEEEIASRTVDLGRGEERELSIELPATWNPEVAVAGRLEGENGDPLAGEPFLVHLGRGGWMSWHTDRNGGFEIPVGERTSDSVTVVVGEDWDRPAVEHPVRRVPFGTRDLVFREVETPRIARYELQLFDAESGAPIDPGREAEVFLVDAALADAPYSCESTDYYSDSYRIAYLLPFPYRLHYHHAEPGWRAELASRPGVSWRAVAAGYRTAEGPLPEPRADGDWTRVEIRLRRGFDHELRLIDGETGRPCPGARVVDERGRLLGRSDEGGVARLAAERWPSRIEIQLEGYANRRWPGGDFVLDLGGLRWVELKR